MAWRALGVALVLGVTAAAPAAVPIREARWLAPGADRVAVLTTELPECLVMPADAVAARAVEIGRAAFSSPHLLGGQAARAGLSCAACHANGHGNSDFVFPGLSGPPGTADVTSFLVSPRRGNDSFQPRPIPSLYDPPRLADRNPALPALRDFIRGLIVEEFDGPEPADAVLDGLAAYVRALDPGCRAKPRQPVLLAVRIADVDRAARSAMLLLADGDTASAQALLLAARDRLGRIAERFPGTRLAEAHAVVRAQDAQLAAIAARAAADPAGTRAALDRWLAALPVELRPVTAAAGASLFAPDQVRILVEAR